jgi:hypothetical protein
VTIKRAVHDTGAIHAACACGHAWVIP